MASRQNKAVTLMELLIAVFLLGTVVVTAVTLELALRRMQVKPADESKLLDEVMPVIDRIKKDFERQIGWADNTSLSIEESGRRLVIRVDTDYSGTISPGDQWHAYRWYAPGTETSGPIEYYADNITLTEIYAQGITGFVVSSAYNNTAINVAIRIRKNPNLPEDKLTNPGVNLTTTIFSRMTSGI